MFSKERPTMLPKAFQVQDTEVHGMRLQQRLETLRKHELTLKITSPEKKITIGQDPPRGFIMVNSFAFSTPSAHSKAAGDSHGFYAVRLLLYKTLPPLPLRPVAVSYRSSILPPSQRPTLWFLLLPTCSLRALKPAASCLSASHD